MVFRTSCPESLFDMDTEEECTEKTSWVNSEVVWKITDGISDCSTARYLGIYEECYSQKDRKYGLVVKIFLCRKLNNRIRPIRMM